ncbi:MAG TPA: histidine kinase [Haliscomenobacter sp.]|uniref:sensor histidine kinase n=1 Tax=Haliscomenobacter sp. TaxID=2717303 RepID=UPI002C40FF34|nr:histidine kinase [Haliscomenobacter sp.]HOY19369.1 histidine kinase [Haliscomenobacter sp.]HPH19873.1 histidine kinase [Haliscomenobacter sp.]
MKKMLLAIVQFRFLQHLLFWTVAGFIIYRITAYSASPSQTDIYYTFLFLLPASWVVYWNISLIEGLLPKHLYWRFFLSTILLLGSGVLWYYLIMEYLVDFIFPGYYFISYYQPGEILLFLSAFWALSSLLNLSKGWFREQEQKQKIQHLEKQKTQAELDALKAQLDPHFLFNNLNSLYSLALEENPKTPEAILKLSENLRYVLYEGIGTEVDLQKEIQHLSNYFQLQQWRFGEEMEITLDIDVEKNEESIAPLLLLPLVENSFKHVGRNRTGLYAVRGKIRLLDGKMIFSLQNTIGEKSALLNTPMSGGIGLVNLQKRLEILYPNRYYFNTLNTDNEFIAKLELQLKP